MNMFRERSYIPTAESEMRTAGTMSHFVTLFVSVTLNEYTLHLGM